MATTKISKQKHTATDLSPPETTPVATTGAPGALVAPETTAIATTGAPGALVADDSEYGEDAGRGFENQDGSDRRIPMLSLLQDGSPTVKRKEAIAGQWVNSVTGDKYDAVDFVPAVTDTAYVAWIPRDDKGVGGGFKGRYRTNDPIVLKAIKDNGGNAFGKIPYRQVDADGRPRMEIDNKGKERPAPDQELVESREVAAIIVQAYLRDAAGVLQPIFETSEPQFPCMISFTSTKIRPYKDWNTSISYVQTKVADAKNPGGFRKVAVPMFAHVVRMGSRFEPKNNGYYVQTLEPVNGDIKSSMIKRSDERYQAAKLLNEQVASGLARGNYESTESDHAAEPSSAGSEAASAF